MSHPQITPPIEDASGTTNITTSTRNSKATSGKASLMEQTFLTWQTSNSPFPTNDEDPAFFPTGAYSFQLIATTN